MTSSSKGKGKGRCKFKFFRILDEKFERKVLEFLYKKVVGLDQYLKIRLGGNEWRKSKSVWMQDVPSTSYLMTIESSSNPKINVTSSQFLTTSSKNTKK
jgi:hypothetical protein